MKQNTELPVQATVATKLMDIATAPPPLTYVASGPLGILLDELAPSTRRFDGWIRVGIGVAASSVGMLMLDLD